MPHTTAILQSNKKVQHTVKLAKPGLFEKAKFLNIWIVRILLNHQMKEQNLNIIVLAMNDTFSAFLFLYLAAEVGIVNPLFKY